MATEKTCLWLTLADPDPATNGQYIYSSGLIRSLGEAGVKIDVLGFQRPEHRRRPDQRTENVAWHLGDYRPRSNWRCLVSTLPQISKRTQTLEHLARLKLLQAATRYDFVVFDSIAMGWALGQVQAHAARGKPPPKLIYLAHNHERSVANAMVACDHRPLRRLVKRIDALKVARLERRLTLAADLVTSNALEDKARFEMDDTKSAVLFLPPGFGGYPIHARHITGDVPRRVVLIGNFDWLPKRHSLESFVLTADPLFAAAGIEVQVVGYVEPAVRKHIAQRARAVRFMGPVGDIVPYMASARLAIIPDMLSGFKLKCLDYIFNRLPIFGLEGAIPGLPLPAYQGIQTYKSHMALALGAIAAVDDLPLLNTMQNRAFLACRDHFMWPATGLKLRAALEAC